MLPARVRFSGFELDPADLLTGRVVRGPIDPAWCRVRFEVERGMTTKLFALLDGWLAANLNERWAIYTVFQFTGTLIVIAFESDVDAVMFRLKSGEKAWYEEDE